MQRILSLALGLLLLGTWGALAQSTFINPNGAGGGYAVMTPGQPMTSINPNGAGGDTAMTPGQPMTFINPNGAGGYTVTTPGALQPQGNSGAAYPYQRYHPR